MSKIVTLIGLLISLSTIVTGVTLVRGFWPYMNDFEKFGVVLAFCLFCTPYAAAFIIDGRETTEQRQSRTKKQAFCVLFWYLFCMFGSVALLIVSTTNAMHLKSEAKRQKQEQWKKDTETYNEQLQQLHQAFYDKGIVPPGGIETRQTLLAAKLRESPSEADLVEFESIIKKYQMVGEPMLPWMDEMILLHEIDVTTLSRVED